MSSESSQWAPKGPVLTGYRATHPRGLHYACHAMHAMPCAPPTPQAAPWNICPAAGFRPVCLSSPFIKELRSVRPRTGLGRAHALAGRRAYGGRKILREVFRGRFPYENTPAWAHQSAPSDLCAPTWPHQSAPSDLCTPTWPHQSAPSDLCTPTADTVSELVISLRKSMHSGPGPAQVSRDARDSWVVNKGTAAGPRVPTPPAALFL